MQEGFFGYASKVRLALEPTALGDEINGCSIYITTLWVICTMWVNEHVLKRACGLAFNKCFFWRYAISPIYFELRLEGINKHWLSLPAATPKKLVKIPRYFVNRQFVPEQIL